MQLRLIEAELRGEHYHGHGITGDQGEHGAGHAAKLGIVKLGKVAGKVRIVFHLQYTYYHRKV